MINTGTSSQAWNILDKIQQDVRTDYARLRVEQCFLSDESPRDEINLLSDEACEYLINHTDKHIDGGRIDTVDGEPEWQVNYLQKDMENMCGEAKIDNIVNIAYEMNSEITNAEFFVRKYGDGARGKLRHHCDLSLVSMTILLNNFSDYEGGEFEYLNNREVKQSKVVNKGCGSFHNGLTIHGVEPVTRGNRWTLIAFFFDPENEYANEYNIIEWKK